MGRIQGNCIWSVPTVIQVNSRPSSATWVQSIPGELAHQLPVDEHGELESWIPAFEGMTGLLQSKCNSLGAGPFLRPAHAPR